MGPNDKGVIHETKLAFGFAIEAIEVYCFKVFLEDLCNYGG